MALSRLLRRRVEPGGELLEKIDPPVVALLSLYLAEPDDHQVLLGGYIYVLPILAARREVILTVRCVYPPEVLVVLRRICARVRACGLFDPSSGDELLIIPLPF